MPTLTDEQLSHLTLPEVSPEDFDRWWSLFVKKYHPTKEELDANPNLPEVQIPVVEGG